MENEKEQAEVVSKYTEVKQNLVIMEKSLASKENKQFQKICQQIKKVEKNLSGGVLKKVLEDFLAKDNHAAVLKGEVSQEKHELSKQ